jgi:hypothetical protein
MVRDKTVFQKKMRIAVIADSRVPGERANSTAVANTTQGFAELGHDVTLILPNRGVNKKVTDEDIEVVYGFKPLFRRVILLSTDNKVLKRVSKKLWFQISSWAFALAVRWHLLKNRYDLVYSRSQYVSLLCGGVFEAHTYSLAKRIMVRRCGIVAINQVVRDAYGRGSVARLGYRKIKPKLVWHNNVVYVGSGSKEGEGRMLSSSRHMITKVTGVPYREVWGFLEGAKVLVLPASGKYNCPLKLVEYMSVKKPIVAPDQPNIRELLGDYGYYFTPGDVGGMDQQIDLALQQGRVSYKQPTTWAKRAEQTLINLYGGTVHCRGG